MAGLDVSLDYSQYNILKPQLTIYISLQEKIRQERINKRGKSELDKVLEKEDTRKAFLNEFSNFSNEFISFNNDLDEVDEKLMHFYLLYIKEKN